MGISVNSYRHSGHMAVPIIPSASPLRAGLRREKVVMKSTFRKELGLTYYWGFDMDLGV